MVQVALKITISRCEKKSSAQKKSKSARSLFGQGEGQNSEATLLETNCNDDVLELTEMCTDASDNSDTESVSDTESLHSAENNTSSCDIGI